MPYLTSWCINSPYDQAWQLKFTCMYINTLEGVREPRALQHSMQDKAERSFHALCCPGGNYFGERNILFFSMETSKSSDPGRGPNHSIGGGGWRERNGFSKLYFHYHFVIIVSSKESFIVGWWRHGERDYHFSSTI